MSTDATYILSYDALDYLCPTPMQKDINYLKEKYGGYFERIGHHDTYWEKPKHTLLQEEIDSLYADAVLEKKSCDQWKIVK